MEEKGIIHKSHSDCASPLVLVWKKNGNIVNAQGQDSTLCRILYNIERCQKPSKREQAKESTGVRRLLKHHYKLVVCNGVLYKKVSRHQNPYFDLCRPEVVEDEKESL
ncbi:hypothetical protein QQF64_036084 [Cirrhinus molitorella]|uniref:Uncharacterized protein n=1 Tax=Cirrhinus molitorella TaxID=172907 RepID=A0ABR3NHL6_9TELE